ncbi:hypothetical protein K505DRAFT_36231 [Melanomma pulvis-pyrius CBS 109.77]|uniref:Uncharacterized protein n=1 Tax=Melanomma pulvis-pyrius CBS 109.77 TaxID=1314802 RepID=A0A6A6XCV6_9PLEO|nr:hypothetical protein K505DRAFT_36231 [Melanomma pulvis-pyrius CBS 109.77]
MAGEVTSIGKNSPNVFLRYLIDFDLLPFKGRDRYFRGAHIVKHAIFSKQETPSLKHDVRYD